MTLEQFRHALEKEAQNSTDRQLVIQSDARVPYSTIVTVMNMAFEFRFRAVNLATREETKTPSPPK
jgi:biopolymer transport protein ExbD